MGSNASVGGARFRISIQLPPSGSASARALSQFFVSISVRGVGCSLDGLSVLRIDLAPPGSSLGATGDWVVRAPVWDLVPSGSCDPRCSNASALVDLSGASLCLDDAVVRGMGAPNYGPLPILAPGDHLTLTVTNGSGQGLKVYENDTTNPLLSSSWSYGNGTLVNPGSLAPYEANRSAPDGWAFGSAVGYGWTNCPILPTSGLSGCDSYDASIDAALAFPQVTNASVWNASRIAYADPFPSASIWSSSGGCQGAANVTTCADFSTGGGSSYYPTIGLVASGGLVRVSYGPNASGRIGPWSPSGFDPAGADTPVAPALLTGARATSNGTAVQISLRASDPRGISHVVVQAVWCFQGGSSTSPSAQSENASEGTGPSNGSMDGSFVANFSRGNNQTGGTFYYSYYEVGGGAAPPGPTTYGKLSLASSGLTCGAISTPAPLVVAATPRSLGYEVRWGFPNALEPNVQNFSIVAVPASGPPTVVRVPNVHARTGLIEGLASGTAYQIAVHTTQVDGRLGQTAPVNFSALATLDPFSVVFAPSSLELEQPGAIVSLTADAFGGASPYDFEFLLGNGTDLWVYGQGSVVTVTVSYANYVGLALLGVVANDANGDVAASPRAPMWVNGSAEGVDVVLATGDSAATISWSAPIAPGPIARYVVFYTQSVAALGRLLYGWPANGTGPSPVEIWNTTGTTLRVPATDGSPIFAEVIAWDPYGPGLDPAQGPERGVPAPFVLTSFAPSPGTAYGGPAPFVAQLTASTAQGTLDPLAAALFSVVEIAPTPGPVNVPVSPVLQSSSNASVTSGWVNASVDLNATGTFLVQVHLTDLFLDPVLIASIYLYVGPGGPPTASMSVATRLPFAGSPVALQASASDSPGPYNYSWQFGDGTGLFDAGPFVNHTYTSSGVFTLGLTVVDNTTGGTVTVTSALTLYGTPQVRIAASEGSNGTLSWLFQAIEIGGSGKPLVAWSFGDGSQGNGQNASHTFAAAGPYTIQVRLTDPSGLSANANLTLYAGGPNVPPTTVSYSPEVQGLVLVLLLLALALGVLAYFAFRKARSLQRRLDRPPPNLYPGERPPLPPPKVD